MPLFEETWEEQGTLRSADYRFNDMQNLITMPENALRVIQALPFRFEEYKVDPRDQANQRLACWAYDRAFHECNNQYGIFGSGKVKECVVGPGHAASAPLAEHLRQPPRDDGPHQDLLAREVRHQQALATRTEPGGDLR